MIGTKITNPIVAKKGCPKKMNNLNNKESSKATAKLDPGPAIEIRAASFLGLFKLYGSNMTGLPQPNPTMKSISSPIGSRWTNGLRVSLP